MPSSSRLTTSAILAFLAEFTGFSVSFISDVERGKATAEIGKTLRLLMILGLDLSVERRA